MNVRTMKCKECGEEIFYNYHYECFECDCGACYNGAGGELAPISQWKDEYDSEDYDY